MNDIVGLGLAFVVGMIVDSIIKDWLMGKQIGAMQDLMLHIVKKVWGTK